MLKTLKPRSLFGKKPPHLLLGTKWPGMRSGVAVGLVAVALFLLTACEPHRSRSPKITKQYIEKHGSWQYRADYAATWRATVMALQSEGYSVALQNPSRHFMMTQHKLIQVSAEATQAYGRPTLLTNRYHLQLVVRFRPGTLGGTIVKLEPRVYQNGQYVSIRTISHAWLKAVFKRLLRRIYDALPARSVAPGPSRPRTGTNAHH